MRLVLKVLHELNIGARCRDLNVGLWSCPQFLFLIMGIIIIGVIIISYFIGQRYAAVEIVTLIIIVVTVFLFIISFIIVRAFEQVVKSRISESKQAEEILKLKDQFVFIAAHELRTPANAIKWGLDSLRSEQRELAQKADDLLSIIARANDRLLRFVEDMLEVARIENHTIIIKRDSVSVQKLIPEVESKLATHVKKQGVTLTFELSNTLPVVRGDAMRLAEVFTELLTSISTMSTEGDIIRVSAHYSDAFLTVEAHAQNMVLSDTDQQHIFDKFPESNITHGAQETGLGLFIVKQLIELMGGKITCASHPESGTAFSFSLERA